MLAGSGVVAVSAVAGALLLVSQIRSGKSAVPEQVAAYNDSLVSYLKVANKGVLDAHGVGRLLADLDAMVSHVDAGGRRIKVDFTAKRSQALHSLVLAYTVQLAEARGLDVRYCWILRQRSAGSQMATPLKSFDGTLWRRNEYFGKHLDQSAFHRH